MWRHCDGPIPQGVLLKYLKGFIVSELISSKKAIRPTTRTSVNLKHRVGALDLLYEDVPKSFRTGRLEQELQIV
jgi:hypothetical protein